MTLDPTVITRIVQARIDNDDMSYSQIAELTGQPETRVIRVLSGVAKIPRDMELPRRVKRLPFAGKAGKEDLW